VFRPYQTQNKSWLSYQSSFRIPLIKRWGLLGCAVWQPAVLHTYKHKYGASIFRTASFPKGRYLPNHTAHIHITSVLRPFPQLCGGTATNTSNPTHIQAALKLISLTHTPLCVCAFIFIAKGSHLQLLQKSRPVNLYFTIVFQIQLSNTQCQRLNEKPAGYLRLLQAGFVW
jgi:hypothetical protein